MIRIPGALLALSAIAGPVPTVDATESPIVLARTGDPAPGGGIYRSLYPPILNEAGIVVFRAQVEAPPDSPRIAWFMVDTYRSMTPERVLAPDQPTPDGDGLLSAAAVFLRPMGQEFEFKAVIDQASPGTGKEGWYTRHADGSITERIRGRKPLDLVDGGAATIPCFPDVRRHTDGRLVFHGELVADPDVCPQGLGGPAVAYMLETDGTARKLVAPGDPVANRPGSSIGAWSDLLQGGSIPQPLFGFLYDGGAYVGNALFLLDGDQLTLDFADGDVVPGVGQFSFGGWAAFQDLPGGGYLLRGVLPPTAQVPQRHGFVHLAGDDSVVLLETGQDIPGFGRVEAISPTGLRVGRSMAQIVTLPEGPAVLGVSVDGLVLGARTNQSLPGIGPVAALGQLHVLHQGSVVHVARLSGTSSSPAILVRAEAGGPRALLPATMVIDGVSHRFDWSNLPIDPPVNERGQIVAWATPDGGNGLAGKIVYFGERVFGDGFEL